MSQILLLPICTMAVLTAGITAQQSISKQPLIATPASVTDAPSSSATSNPIKDPRTVDTEGKAREPDGDGSNRITGNPKHDNSKYCLAKDGGPFLVYLSDAGSTAIDLPDGNFTLAWFNPRTGELDQPAPLTGNNITAPGGDDWLALIRRD